MTTEFVKLELKNNPASAAVLERHKEVIEQYGNQEYVYHGFVPTKIGPSGKLLEIELVFQK